ncbi:MAG: type II secretion system protein GspG [Acidobacteriia bacterium]|nr:type II secretion system protein GspG [Terriglobia bacterium]
MRNFSRLCWYAGLIGLSFLPNGCGGRAVNKKTARDVIVGSPADALTKADLEVLSVTQVGSSEAVVETQLHSAFRLQRSGSEWVVCEVRVGHGQWEKVNDIMRALQQVKIDETRQSLEKIAAATEAYRQKNGRLPEFKDYIGLSDALYPLYLSPLIREDAWKHPLAAFRLGSDAIRLISAGPDGKQGTPDDIELTKTFPR